MFSCMSDIEHYQNEYENGRTRGILRNDPLANKLGMVEDGLSYSPIKVLALTLQSCIGRTYFASDLLHYFYFVTHLLNLSIIYEYMPYLSIFCTYSMCRHTMFFQSNVVLS